MIKIALKTIFGEIYFEYQKENNTVKETVEEMLKAKKGEVIRFLDLMNLDLSEITFDGSRFDGSRFDGSRFDGSTFDGSTFVRSTFVRSTFDGSRFDGSTFDGSRFDGSRFDGSTFDGSTFDGSTFDGSRFDGSTFDGSTFVRSTFVRSTFVRSTFVRSTFDGSTFDGSTFDGSTFVRSTFVRSRFDGSTFDGSTFDNDTIKNIIENGMLYMFDYIKHDFWAVLLKAKHEITALRKEIEEGRIDGSTYEGQCSCLKGTISKIQECDYNKIPGMKADSSEPCEQWFMMIKPGMIPETSEVVKLTLSWIDEFLKYLNN